MGQEKNFFGISLNRKVWVSVSLVSLIPILVVLCQHYGGYVTFWALFILPFLVLLGWAVIFKIVGVIKNLSWRSRHVLESIGESAPRSADELQSLECFLSVLSDKVKCGFEQLQQFTQKIDNLNKKLSRKVLLLSTLLQANDLFSKETPAEEVVKFLNYHLQQLLESDICFCVARESPEGVLKVLAASGISSERLSVFIDKKTDVLLTIGQTLVIDCTSHKPDYGYIGQELAVKHFALAPIIIKGKSIGVIGIGRIDDNFAFCADDIEALNLFAHNISLIWEHERLTSKIATLEIVDHLTGLYNERMLYARLEEEIKRAVLYQRPCGFIELELTGFAEFQKRCGLIKVEELVKEVAVVFKNSLQAIDIAGRLAPNRLGAILIERNKRQCKKLADELSLKLVELCRDKVGISFAVADSPVDGMNAQELLDFTNTHKIQSNEV